MGETTNTMAERNAGQAITIGKQAQRIKELELWERFASHLINNYINQTVTPENLELWLADATKRKV